MSKYPVIIGRSETIDIVGCASGVPAKIDTGAFRSAIHSSEIKVTKNKNGVEVLTAKLLGHPLAKKSTRMEFERFDTVVVTNSFGHKEQRYEVRLRVKLGPKVVTTLFTLADRSNNFFPILVGRKLLKRRYIVDSSQSGLSNRAQLKKTFKGDLPDDFVD